MSRKGIPSYKPEDVAAALKAANGFVSVAAEALGCSYSTVHRHITEHDICRQACVDSRCKMLDFTESKLFTAIKNGESWAIALYLKTQGKERGYVERQEHTGADGSPIVNPDIVKISSDKLKKIRAILSDANTNTLPNK